LSDKSSILNLDIESFKKNSTNNTPYEVFLYVSKKTKRIFKYTGKPYNYKNNIYKTNCFIRTTPHSTECHRMINNQFNVLCWK